MSSTKKLLVGLLIGPLLSVHLLAQSQRVSLVADNMLIGRLADSLIHKTGVGISGDILSQSLCVSLRVTNELPENVLKTALAGLPVNVQRDGNNITVITTGTIWRWVKGYVRNTRGYPLEGVTVKLVNGCKNMMTTDARGYYSMHVPVNGDSLRFSHINANTQTIAITSKDDMEVMMEEKADGMDEVLVTDFKLNAQVPRGSSLGSHIKLDSPFRNRAINSAIPVILDGRGVLFQRGELIVRGPNTIHSDRRPLIVVNGFPFEGDFLSINPMDIESIDVLRDALSASVWGARAGNGVIVITTRSGRYNSPWQINVAINTLAGQKPDVFSNRQYMDSKSFIAFEEWLFENGFYDNTLAKQSGFPAISPVVTILDRKRKGLLTATETTYKLDSLRQIDVRNDLARYYYQAPLRQQYVINVEGGDLSRHSLFSLGYDRQRSDLQRNHTNRFTASLNHLQKLRKWNAELSISWLLALHEAVNNNQGAPAGLYPYQALADATGNFLAVTKDYQDDYTDTAGGGRLLDWKNRPLQDLQLADNKQQLQETFITVRLRKFLSSRFILVLSGQWQSGQLKRTENNSPDAYFTRNLVNRYTQILDSKLVHPIPPGTIRDEGHSEYTARNMGVQLQYIDSASRRNYLALAAGIDVNSRTESSGSTRIYGYQKNGLHASVNTEELYPLYLPDQWERIPPISEYQGYSTIFLAGYATASFLYHKRWSFSTTLRKDASNTFGRNTNKWGRPLYAVGAGWQISRERFYPLKKMIPSLNLRVTHGTTGNVNRTVTSQTTAMSIGLNPNNRPASYIINPPNPDLRWEKTAITNFALEASTLRDRLHITAEYYYKRSWDLFANSPLDYTTGATEFFGNAANMMAHGFDINLVWKYGNKKIWGSSSLWVSHVTDRITHYQAGVGTVGDYIKTDKVAPLAGRSYFTLYSLPTAGLDARNGALLARIQGQPSTTYGEVISSADVDQYLIDAGSIVPRWFGSLINSISYERFTLSATINFKFDYVFRRSSISYTTLATTGVGHTDWVNRWQQPGDELNTSVPAALYPLNEAMDNYYEASDLLVTRGDHISLQHCQLLYELPPSKGRKFQYIHIYCYADNIGLLWRANKNGIDPNYPNGMAPGCSLGVGVRLGLQPKKIFSK